MVKQIFYILVISLSLMLGACITTTTTKEMPADVISDEYKSNVVVDERSETTGLEDEGALSVSTLGHDNVIYFAYDSAEVRDESMPLIMAAAESLIADPTMQMRLEGHADERGTREYNLALGERRAQAIRDLILLQGVSSDQLDIVSYGEERPVVMGSDEEFWQQNRRVELVY